MQYVECPALCPDSSIDGARIKIFLAGGISNCPDWQVDALNLFAQSSVAPELCIINPRRSNFDVSDKNATKVQIHWEADHLKLADVILFWFPCETLCPISLYELGSYSHYKDAQNKCKPIFIGAHPQYQRLEDIIVQTTLVRPEVTIVHTVPELVQQVVEHCTK